MNKFLPLLLLSLILFFSKVKAQTQLTNFHSQSGEMGSGPSGFVAFNNLLFFQTSTEDTGREIWVTDGNTNNTRLLKDIYPGKESAIYNLNAVVLGGQLFFIADDGENGPQIWATKGTEQSTIRITNIPNLYTSKLTLVGDNFFFLVKGNEELHVWKSNGTQSGTMLVKGNLPAWNTPTYEGLANNLFFFSFQDKGSNDSRVWRSDGSEAGTFPITPTLDGNGAGPGGTAALTQYIVYKNELYFVARSSSIFSLWTSVGIMKTDGTIANTVPVKGIHDGNINLVNLADVIEVNGKLYFSFFQANYKRFFIWESNGTDAGTKKIYDQTATKYVAPSNLSSDGNNLLFTGKNTREGTSLLKLNIPNYQVEEIKELAANPADPFFYMDYMRYHITRLPNNKYVIFEPSSIEKGWITDLTAANTNPVKALGKVREIIVFSDNIYFAGYSDAQGSELWKSDLNFSNPSLFANINTNKFGSGNFISTVVGNKLFYSVNDGEHGAELWVYDKFSKEQKLVKDFLPGTASSFPFHLVNYNDNLYFSNYTPEYGRQLWRTDGTEAGTIKVKNVDDLPNYASFGFLTKGLGKLFFVTRINDHNFLCITDGISTKKITDLGINEYNVPFSVTEIVATSDLVYFLTEAAGGDLWRSDGTEEGTYKIKDFYSAKYLTAVNDKVYFAANEGNDLDTELWQSTGSTTETKLVKNIGETYSAYPEQLVKFKDQLVFTAYTQETGREFWKSDGTATGTRIIADLNPGTASSVATLSANYYSSMFTNPKPTQYAILNNFLYFSANDGTHGTELWKTDGSTEGTLLVNDFNKGSVGSFPSDLKSNENKLYFSAYTPEIGSEVWVSEGSASTSKPLFDLTIGVHGSDPTGFNFLKDTFFFSAIKNNDSRQVWFYQKEQVTGINDTSLNESISLYPNPTADYLFLKTDNVRIKSYKILNAQGKYIPTNSATSDKIFVGNLAPGLYFMLMELNNKSVISKFIKK